MIRPRFTNTLVLLILLTLPCSGCARDDCSFSSHATDASPVIADSFGVNIGFTDPRPGEMKMLAGGGFRWVRMDLKWDLTEPAKGRYDFAPYDRLMASLEQYDLRALFILDYTNPAYDSGKPPHTDEARLAFARWAVTAAKHFAGRGVLWEIYNEPNIAQFWPPRPNVDDYVALALAVGRAFREGAPGEKLIGPATSGIDFAFLEACFKAGLLEYWSAVSVHPYRRSDPESAAIDYCRLRKMIKAYAPATVGSGSAGNVSTRSRSDGALKRSISIISSEWGYSAAWSGVDESQQSQLLARSWLTNAANDISVSIWYDWQDDGSETAEPEHHFGSVYHPYREGRESVFDPKPAYFAARTLSSFFRGCRFEKRLNVGGDDDYVLVFRKGVETRIAAWTTASRAHRVMIPLEPGKYNGVTHTGQSTTMLTADATGLALTLSNAPVYLAR